MVSLIGIAGLAIIYPRLANASLFGADIILFLKAVENDIRMNALYQLFINNQ